jgi:glycosyltransferase involved in cell wall biosynthesis
MKIAIITDGIFPFIVGGMQQHSTSLAKHLVLSGNNVTLFHFVKKRQPLPSEDEVNMLFFNNENKFHKVFCLCFPTSVKFPGHYLYNSFKYSKLVYDVLKNDLNSFDFIYTKGFSGWKLINEKVKGDFKPKIGVKFHGYEMYQYAPNFKVKLQHLMLRPFVKKINLNADVVFSYGSKITQIIKNIGVSNSKIIEISSAINSDWISEKKLTNFNPLKFLFVGRYERRKGINEINEVIKIIDKANLKAEFHFVGPIPIKNRLKGHNVRVVYHGEIIDEQSKINIYDSCDVLLCPSYSEGMPNVILEAMSRGLVIIASDVGAINLLVSNENGILIKNSDTENIITAIKKIILFNKKTLIKMKKSSISKVEYSFVWEKVVNHNIELISSSLNK